MAKTMSAQGSKKIRVTMVRSLAGREPQTIDTMKALGLTRIGRQREFALNRPLLGMLKSVSHLVSVEEVR